MKNYILILILFFSLNSYSVEIVIESYGLYGVSGSKRVLQMGAPSGYTNLAERFYLLETTNKIPMKLGETFGLMYRVEEGCENGVVLEERIMIPNATMVRPKDSFKVSEIIGTFVAECGAQLNFMFGFDEERELVPGKWVFSIGPPSKTLISKEFNIE